MSKIQSVEAEKNRAGFATGGSLNRADLLEIGRTVKELRQAHRMTLQELSAKCGRTAGYLSLIERGRVHPTVETLKRIADQLEVSLNWFFPENFNVIEDEKDIIVRGDNMRTLTFKNGIKNELLSPNLAGPLEMLKTTLEPGASSGDDYGHPGREAGYVAEGELELTLKGKTHRLKVGDAFSFNCEEKHRFGNPGDRKAVVIWVLTPPTF